MAAICVAAKANTTTNAPVFNGANRYRLYLFKSFGQAQADMNGFSALG